MKQIVILGAGGNTKVILDIVKARIALGEKIGIRGILDDDISKTELCGIPIIGKISNVLDLAADQSIWFLNGIGSNLLREEMVNRYGVEIRYDTAVHPSAIMGSDVVVGHGTVIMPRVVINSGTTIGNHVILNTGSIIEHDNRIGDFAHLASGTVTAGNVSVGKGAMLGTGTRVIQGISIGEKATVGAGAVVINDIAGSCTVVGIPAKAIKRGKED